MISMSDQIEPESCDSCGHELQPDERVNCYTCNPWAGEERRRLSDLVPWAQDLIHNHPGLLEDEAPIPPPSGEWSWYVLLNYLIGDVARVGADELTLDDAWRKYSNQSYVYVYPRDAGWRGMIVEYWTDFKSPECWNDRALAGVPDRSELRVPEIGEWTVWDLRPLELAFTEYVSGIVDENPVLRMQNANERQIQIQQMMYSRRLFIVDIHGLAWASEWPETLFLREALADLLLDVHGSDIRKRFLAGVLNGSIYVYDYLDGYNERCRVLSMQKLRSVIDSSLRLTAGPMGIRCFGISGARYLISASKSSAIHSGPAIIVYNSNEIGLSTNHSICMYSSGKHTSIEKTIPFGDRLVALALGLVNDTRTSVMVPTMRMVVDRFLSARARRPELSD